LLGSDFPHVDQITGSSEQATYNTAPVAASTITISSGGIFLQNFLGMQEGLHSHTAQSRHQKLVRRCLFSSFWAFERRSRKARGS